MIINLKDINRLRKFILDEPTEEEIDICNNCDIANRNDNNDISNIQCKDKDICFKYTPVLIEDKMSILLTDLFDTLENLINNQIRKDK